MSDIELKVGDVYKVIKKYDRGIQTFMKFEIFHIDNNSMIFNCGTIETIELSTHKKECWNKDIFVKFVKSGFLQKIEEKEMNTEVKVGDIYKKIDYNTYYMVHKVDYDKYTVELIDENEETLTHPLGNFFDHYTKVVDDGVIIKHGKPLSWIYVPPQPEGHVSPKTNTDNETCHFCAQPTELLGVGNLRYCKGCKK